MSSRLWPVGAVSSTTKLLRASLTTRLKAWNTATSSVQGDCRSSSSRALPCSSSAFAARGHDFVDVGVGLGLGVDAAHLQSFEKAVQRIGHVRGGVGGGEVGAVAARCTRPTASASGDGAFTRRLCPGHNEAVADGGEFVGHAGEKRFGGQGAARWRLPFDGLANG